MSESRLVDPNNSCPRCFELGKQLNNISDELVEQRNRGNRLGSAATHWQQKWQESQKSLDLAIEAGNLGKQRAEDWRALYRHSEEVRQEAVGQMKEAEGKLADAQRQMAGHKSDREKEQMQFYEKYTESERRIENLIQDNNRYLAQVEAWMKRARVAEEAQAKECKGLGESPAKIKRDGDFMNLETRATFLGEKDKIFQNTSRVPFRALAEMLHMIMMKTSDMDNNLYRYFYQKQANPKND